MLVAILIYLIQILSLLIFLEKEHCLPMKYLALLVVPGNDVNFSFCRFTYLCYGPQVYAFTPTKDYNPKR